MAKQGEKIQSNAATKRSKQAKAGSGAINGFALGFLVGLCAVVLDAKRVTGQSATQSAAAASPAPGRAAVSAPTDLPARRWKAVLARTWIEFNGDHIPAVAAGATFFGLLALFPALGVFVSLYGLFADVEQARQQVMNLRGVLPEGAISVLSEQMARLASTPHSRLGLAFATSLAVSLWSSNAGVKALIAGLN